MYNKIYETNIDPNIKPFINEEIDEVLREIEQKCYAQYLDELEGIGFIRSKRKKNFKFISLPLAEIEKMNWMKEYDWKTIDYNEIPEKPEFSPLLLKNGKWLLGSEKENK